MRMSLPIGTKFSRLTIIGEVKPGFGHSIVLCRCLCKQRDEPNMYSDKEFGCSKYIDDDDLDLRLVEEAADFFEQHHRGTKMAVNLRRIAHLLKTAQEEWNDIYIVVSGVSRSLENGVPGKEAGLAVIEPYEERAEFNSSLATSHATQLKCEAHELAEQFATLACRLDVLQRERL